MTPGMAWRCRHSSTMAWRSCVGHASIAIFTICTVQTNISVHPCVYVCLYVKTYVFTRMQVLDWAPVHAGAAIVSILDTGSSCLMLPNSTYDGTYENSPYDIFHRHSTQSPGLDIEITFGMCHDPCPPWNLDPRTNATRCCKTFKIPAKHWMAPGGCVQPFPGINIILLGDPIFRLPSSLVFLSSSR